MTIMPLSEKIEDAIAEVVRTAYLLPDGVGLDSLYGLMNNTRTAIATALQQARAEAHADALWVAARACDIRVGLSRNERNKTIDLQRYEIINIRVDEASQCAETIRTLAKWKLEDTTIGVHALKEAP